MHLRRIFATRIFAGFAKIRALLDIFDHRTNPIAPIALCRTHPVPSGWSAGHRQTCEASSRLQGMRCAGEVGRRLRAAAVGGAGRAGRGAGDAEVYINAETAQEEREIDLLIDFTLVECPVGCVSDRRWRWHCRHRGRCVFFRVVRLASSMAHTVHAFLRLRSEPPRPFVWPKHARGWGSSQCLRMQTCSLLHRGSVQSVTCQVMTLPR